MLVDTMEFILAGCELFFLFKGNYRGIAESEIQATETKPIVLYDFLVFIANKKALLFVI